MGNGRCIAWHGMAWAFTTAFVRPFHSSIFGSFSNSSIIIGIGIGSSIASFLACLCLCFVFCVADIIGLMIIVIVIVIAGAGLRAGKLGSWMLKVVKRNTYVHRC